MRTDAKIGFAIVGVLLTVLAVYAFVIGKHGKPQQAENTSANKTVKVEPDAAVATTDTTNNGATPGGETDPSGLPAVGSPGKVVPPSTTGTTVPPTGTAPANALAAGNAHPAGQLPELPGDTLTPPVPTSHDSAPAPHAPDTAHHRSAHSDSAHADSSTVTAAATHTYRVRAGQTLSSIAAEVYGDSRLWRQIVKDNPGLNPSKLKVGAKIQIPDPAAVRPHASVVVPAADVIVSDEPSVMSVVAGSTYRVRSGDTLYAIAKRYLGSGHDSEKLYELNRDVIGPKMRLRPGTVLRLPTAGNGLLSSAGN